MSASPRRAGGPLAPLVGLFSSIWFGVVLMSLLFIYSSIGSAGVPVHVQGTWFDFDNWVFIPVREHAALELTEFEWFHWWPFDLLIGLICLNITVATLRRIRLNTINLGVWLIHTGILVLCFGSWLYFGNKVEGLTPVARCEVVAETHTGARQRFMAVPNNPAFVGQPDHGYSLRVFEIDPRWVIPSGPDRGQEAYAVQVVVRGPHADQPFVRQLVRGHPELTHDLLAGPEGLIPVIEVTGQDLYDENIELGLEPFKQHWFYLTNSIEKSWALYLREQGTRNWYQRPIEGLPLFNDWIRSPEQVWMPAGEQLPTRSLDLEVLPFEADDPLPGVPLHVSAYLRYAHFEARDVAGGELDPVCTVVVGDGHPGHGQSFELAAFDPRRNTADRGFVSFLWARDRDAQRGVGRFSQPTVTLTATATGERMVHVIEDTARQDPDLDFEDLGDSGYEFRVEFLQDFDQPEMPASVCSVEIIAPDGRHFRRWVSGDGELLRDIALDQGTTAPAGSNPHQPASGLMDGEPVDLDPGLTLTYTAGNFPAPLTVVAGPGEDDLGLVVNIGSPVDGLYQPVAEGENFGLGQGTVVSVHDVMPRSQRQVRPAVVPRRERERNAGEIFAKALVELTLGGRTEEVWVPYQQFPTEGLEVQLLGRGPIRPAVVRLDDGRVLELLLSSERLPMSSPAVLDDFYITSHDGGYTGGVGSIMDWTSVVRFLHEGGSTPQQTVSVNAPIEDQGLWFYQAMWDKESAPRFQGDPGSKGLNYTVLGVGNRVGVMIQLLGCCIAVLGMCYAFYVKPILIKRRVAARTAELAAS